MEGQLGLRTPNYIAPEAGIEPTPRGLEALVLPLHHSGWRDALLTVRAPLRCLIA